MQNQNPKQMAPEAAKMAQQAAEKKKKNRILLIIGIIVAALALVAIIVFGVMSGGEEPHEKPMETTTEAVIYGDEDLGIDPTVDEQLKDYRNIALFGIDTAKIENEQGNRSDGMIIISINEKTDDIKIFSVYRDTYLKIDDSNLDKVNHAYAFGGMDQSLKALNRNLDLNIREGIAMTWDTIADLVDAVDGIEIEILDSEVSTMNRGLSDENKVSAGVQILNGAQAVKYSRIRYDSSKGDHRRNERMQAVLIATLNKAKTLGTSELITIMNAKLDNIKTNMSRNRMTETLMKVADYNIATNDCWPYDTEGWMHDGIYYGVPVTLESNVIELHDKYFAQKDYIPTDFVDEVSQEIEELSGYTK